MEIRYNYGVSGAKRDVNMSEIAFIENFLRSNSEYVLEKFSNKQLLAVANKNGANDLLTEVDLTLQKRFVDQASAAYPDTLVIGEESGLDIIPANPNARVWVIDPIDGTYNFVRGLNPAFGISIALVQEGFAQAAGVFMPLNNLMFLAEAGSGSYCNGNRLKVSTVQQLAEACVEIDFGLPEERRSLIKHAGDIIRQVGQVRCQGAAVMGICQVATGDVDGFLHIGLEPWDFAAAQLIAEEAGAMATRLDGTPLRVFDDKRGMLITNGALHKSLIKML